MAVEGSTARKTTPVVHVPLVTGNQDAAAASLLEVVKVMPAALRGHFSSRPSSVKLAANATGAAVWPMASATGRVLPARSKNDRVSNPASPTPDTAWYSVPHQKIPRPAPAGTRLRMRVSSIRKLTWPLVPG